MKIHLFNDNDYITKEEFNRYRINEEKYQDYEHQSVGEQIYELKERLNILESIFSKKALNPRPSFVNIVETPDTFRTMADFKLQEHSSESKS
jgi:hypothetical protein